ncbi:MAG: PQQ-binding-like beta-propeller repeat protein [Verrucomicrobia bacterium]|nr:PQQ-binding-like beta-propeller repeat protein [Verrucomicrobiota bacterium]MCH8512730.1 PQQ-binding-like beta-propeller repeat protein [Kiritimatiellia bacterium]
MHDSIRLRSLLSMTAAFCLGSMALGEPSVSAEAARARGWPSTQGPLGNRLPLPVDARIMDDPTQARVLWRSEDVSMGRDKLGSGGFGSAERIERFLGTDPEITTGTWASPIVYDNKVLWSSWEPTGPFFTVPFQNEGPEVTYRLDTVDVVVALDFDTGELLWKAEAPGGWTPGGGKRGGHQVTPAAADGRIFSMGSTGRIFAHSVRDGTRLWVTEPDAESQAHREQALKDLAAGKFVAPGGVLTPSVSLVVAEGVLVTPGDGVRSVALLGRNVETGDVIWELKNVCHRDTTPAIWRHGDREYLLVKNDTGVMRLIDPRDGSVRWKLEGLGTSVFSLMPGERTVMVNVNPGRNQSVWGAVDLSPDEGRVRWRLELDDVAFAGPEIAGDSAGHQRAIIRDGNILLGLRLGRRSDRALLLDEETGKVLASIDSDDHEGSGFPHANSTLYPIGNQSYLHRHWPTGGSGAEWYQWRVTPEEGFVMARPLGLPAAIDLGSQRAYEVPNEAPIVAGVMIQRSQEGGVLAIDLTLPEGAKQWEMEWEGLIPGLPPLSTRLLIHDGEVLTGSLRYFDNHEAGMIYSRSRRRAFWMNMNPLEGALTDAGFRGRLLADFDTYDAEIDVEIHREGDTLGGTWRRRIPAVPNMPKTEGAIQGQAAMEVRGYPTGWLEHQPWTPLGENPPGTTTWAVYMHDALPLHIGNRAATLVFDWDGEKVTRAILGAYSYNQAWHEVDPRNLRIEGDRIVGSIDIILQQDRWVIPGYWPDLDQKGSEQGMAGRLTLDGRYSGNELEGSYTAEWGMPLELEGQIRGSEVAF